MKLIRTTLIAAALCVAVAGCGNDDELTDVTSQLGSSSSQSSTESEQADGLNRASGQVAEVAGTTAQVQGDGTQVAVTWNEATTFTAEKAGTVADVEVGACVMVSSSGDAADPVAATTVRVLSLDGDCAMPGGMGGPGGATGPGAGERPSDLPSDLPQPGDGEAPDGQRPGGGPGQCGEVTAGSCLQANGERSSTGTLTATTVAISQPVDGVCERGFGGRRPGADDEDAS
ncbi:hypothetical protein ACLM5J_06930 [Nocardioides sp. Bht2]|uniref:hypothetical protein n=1 Tax=Nocardioides sp. Bht2 TaxID=3392297 RepID=UPI0039B5F52D